MEYGSHYAPRGKRPETKHIVVHCAATPNNSTRHTPLGIVRFHYTPESQGGPRHGPWKSCGYHKIRARDGSVLVTLHPAAIGAHVGDVGHNHDSYGICLMGGIDDRGRPDPNYTPEQWAGLEQDIREALTLWPDAEVLGHRDMIERYGGRPKACPCFDVPSWWAGLNSGPADDGDDTIDNPRPELLSQLVVPTSFTVSPTGTDRLLIDFGEPVSLADPDG